MSSKFGNCKFCNTSNVKMAHSHILPKAFFKEMCRSQNTGYFLVLKPDSDAPPVKNREGLTDDTILCELCETQLSTIDSDGIKALRSITISHLPDNNLRLDSCNYKDIKLMIMFILWRAGAAPTLPDIQLGPYLDPLRALIATRNPGGHCEFPILVEKAAFSTTPLGPSAPTDAITDDMFTYSIGSERGEIMGIHLHTVGINEYIFKMFVGNQSQIIKHIINSPINKCLLSPDTPTLLLQRGFDISPEHQIETIKHVVISVQRSAKAKAVFGIKEKILSKVKNTY